ALKDDVLDVEQTSRAKGTSEVGRVLHDDVPQINGQRLCWVQRDAIARVHAGTLDVFHNPGDQHVATVADGVDLDLGTFEVLVYQQWLLARDLLRDGRELLQFRGVATDFHGAATQNE